MDTNSVSSLKEKQEKPSLLIEVANIEKQLWALIRTKGLLYSEVQELYRKVCSNYEKTIISDHKLAELQEAEYSLWKLHYRHIDEFRKRIKRSSGNEETTTLTRPQNVGTSQRSNENHVEGFKSFLAEATEFYRNLIVKIKRCYGLPEDFCFFRRSCDSQKISVEPKKMRKLQFLCHRFQVCLGDLARYREQCEKPDMQNPNWSVAVTHYLEATMIWPDSGNPQNQLAVLATYVGDDFLALYHCIRSLAVKEPFPDAWNNLSLLFERNSSSRLNSLASGDRFGFSQPSESAIQTRTRSTNDLSNGELVKAEEEGMRETQLFTFIIRTIGFFFIKASLEDFSCNFASTTEELDALMALDDAKLRAAMESYQLMNSARTGPFRTVQVVSIFIFVIENLINCPEVKDSKNKTEAQQLELAQSAVAATFTLMGRLTDRCLKANLLDSCPLLPSLLVFVEWLASILHELEAYGSDDKSKSAMSYFFGSFLELLKRFDNNSDEIEQSCSIALWEDYELRGFAPLACPQMSLDFATHWENLDNFESGSQARANRIVNAAMKIADRSINGCRWILYDKSRRKFSLAGPRKLPDRKESAETESSGSAVQGEEVHQQINKVTEECEKLIPEEKLSGCSANCKSVSLEEEEVILFKPLTRYNSAPLYGAITSNDQTPSKEVGDHVVPADECLRRATSLLISQNQGESDPPALHSGLTNFRRNKPMKQQEPTTNDASAHAFSEASTSPGLPSVGAAISAGPPSLNAWVFNRGSLSNERVKGKSDVSKHNLAPIPEIASGSMNGLSIYETDSVISSRHESVTSHYSSPPYSAPIPSAPFLPDDSVWLNGAQSTFSDYNNPGTINKANNLFDASQVNGYSNWSAALQPLDYYVPGIPGIMEVCPPVRRMTSAEWLRHYRESQNLERTTSNIWPVHSYATGNAGNFHDISRSGLFDQWGAPLASNPLIYEGSPTLHPGFVPAYGTDDQRRENFYYGYQKPNPYGCGVVNQPEPLLQYLKEKEWLIQQDPTLRGPAYMGS